MTYQVPVPLLGFTRVWLALRSSCECCCSFSANYSEIAVSQYQRMTHRRGCLFLIHLEVVLARAGCEGDGMDLQPWKYLQASPSTVRTPPKCLQGGMRTKLWCRGFCIERQWCVCCEMHGHTSVSPTVRVSSFPSLRASSASSSLRTQLRQQRAVLVVC